MSQDDLYVNYSSLKHSAPPLVPRVTPRTIFPEQKCQLTETNEVNVKQANVQTQIPTRYKTKLQPAKIPNVKSFNVSATSISDLADSEKSSENLEAASSDMSHACSNLSLPTYGAEGFKKKRKGIAKFINFLRKLKKGKERLDKILHHPIMQELGVTELIDDA